MSDDKIVQLRENPEIVANSPECQSDYWLILVDDVGNQWGSITGTKCAGCGYVVDWVLAEKQEE